MAKRWTIEEDKCVRTLYARLSNIGHALRYCQDEFHEVVALLNQEKNVQVTNHFEQSLTAYGVMMNMTVRTIAPIGRKIQKMVDAQCRATKRQRPPVRRVKKAAVKETK